MKRKLTITAAAVLLAVCIFISAIASAADVPFSNMYRRGFDGYITDKSQVRTSEYFSSEPVSVSEGETVYFGPCDTAQYFQLVGFNGDTAVTGKIRGKSLTVADRFENDLVIYSYTVPAGINRLNFTALADVEAVYTVSKTAFTNLIFRAYWEEQEIDTTAFVGKSTYQKVNAGDRLYFGAVTKANTLETKIYDDKGTELGTAAASDIALVESFGGSYGIYCYTVPSGNVAYVKTAYDTTHEQYYTHMVINGAGTGKAEIISRFVSAFGVTPPADSTVSALTGKSALFLGDSITYGARDRANIYGAGGWAGRIGYYCGMPVTNNGVSGACVSTKRLNQSEGHYIYNNLIKAKDTRFDYVIMNGLFNDASEGVAVGTAQGAAAFDPDTANVAEFSGALEKLFYTAKQLYPNAKLGYIVRFETERAVDLVPYVNASIAICEDFGIPYLDFYHMPGFTVDLDDGLHPSSLGYDTIYGIIADWMATL